MITIHPDRSIRSASLVAGAGLLALAVLAAFANFVVLEGLVTPGDATATAEAITSSEGLFRAGVASLYVVAVLDVVVAVALGEVFAAVSPRVSVLAAGFRGAYAVVLLVAISHLSAVPPLSGDADRTLAQVEAFRSIWGVSFLFFGAHLLLIGYLAYRSGFVPRVVAVLVAINGLGYLTDLLGTALVPGYSITVANVTFVGEVALMLWLLIQGRRTTVTATVAPTAGEPLPLVP
ncbi:DUF4386 domain-containing protein [Georgenia sp. SYP-B2076]|uniref:DUF4386 domain-containing protein n=1 Tax=Georgenia sp. SYP-B2076 TaxID=2495881 RepID=UPI00197ACB4B|nr:DUF4386 domain-containing protein [Georgenia sp. SYP-B2076]